MNPPLINLRITTAHSYKALKLLQAGKSKDEAARHLGVTSEAVRSIARNTAKRNGIGYRQLMEMLPYVHIFEPKAQGMRIYIVPTRWGTYTVRSWENGGYVHIGTYPDTDMAEQARRQYRLGLPVTPSPARAPSPEIVKRGRKYQARIWDRQNKRQMVVGTYDTHDEALAAWHDAKQNGIYTQKGIVRF